MTTTFIPPPPRVPLVDVNRLITRPWSDWLLNELVARVGGGTAMTNLELEALLNGASQSPFPAVDVQEQDIPPPVLQASDLQQHAGGGDPPFVPPLPAEDPSGLIQALQSELAALRQRVEGLEQGFQL